MNASGPAERDGELVLGIDAGGSKTLARAYDAEGTAVLEVTSSGIDLPAVGEGVARGRLAELRRKVEARLPSGAYVSRTVVGAPGFGELPRWTDAWRHLVQDVLEGWSPSVHNDVRLAFYSAFPAGEGILVLAGTGSMAWGGKGGREVRCGGWGPWFGDEGSAYDIGRQALRAAAAAIDGRGPGTRLVEDLLLAAGVPDLWGLLESLLTSGTGERASVAKLAESVDAAAIDGDEVAAGLIEDAGRALASHAVALSRQLGGDRLPVACAGGAFNSSSLLTAFNSQLARSGMSLADQAIDSPVAGAVAVARLELAKPA